MNPTDLDQFIAALGAVKLGADSLAQSTCARWTELATTLGSSCTDAMTYYYLGHISIDRGQDVPR